MKVFVTGAAGFIGFYLCMRLLDEGIETIGYDNFNDYYDTNLKESRFRELLKKSNNKKVFFKLIKGELENLESLDKIFKDYDIKYIINLGAQAGVRYSIDNPRSYINSNLVGFGNILEISRRFKIKHLVYASSSSVYGGNTKIPFSEKDSVDHPVSLYAATKKSNEMMAHSYSHLYSIPSTGLRFFTVYGPWGRPDMAPMIFTKNILENKPIKIFNNGKMYRDFTYIDDVIESTFRVIFKPPELNLFFDKENPDPSKSWAAHRIFNVGNSSTIHLMEFINVLEKELNKKAIKEFMPMQPGDIEKTAANTEAIEAYIGFTPNTEISYGVKKLVDWYKFFYGT